MTETNVRVDAWVPPEMAEHAENIGAKKASLDWANMLALGTVFATVAMASPRETGAA